jgi:hypothetical protein
MHSKGHHGASGRALARGPLAFLALAGVGGVAGAQGGSVLFSVDYQGPMISQIDPSTGFRITEGDILLPGNGVPTYGPIPPPKVLFRGSQLGLNQYPNCVGHPPGTPCGIEVDAISEGMDARFTNVPAPFQRVWFSVDEYAIGFGPPFPGYPQVASERLVGESCADLFVDTGLPPGPVPPGAVIPRNAGAIDGNGLPGPSPFVYPGVGLIEPNPPGMVLPNQGDNIDALDIGALPGFPPGGIYYSLDWHTIDPLNGQPASNSAQIQGFRGGDVLRVATPGGSPTLYAPALLLGLDRSGPNTDDLDALILVDNGDHIYQPSQSPFDWLPGDDGATTDMLMFSVRRGSAVIGKIDSILGLKIEEGDILTTPLAGGPTPYPGIFIAAENLGLATVRSGTAALFGDEVDALDLSDEATFDCNQNGVDDAVDIATGYSTDTNSNGIPDECESNKMRYCFCPSSYAPCGNAGGVDAGCANSTGMGAKLTTTGSTSVMADDLVISITQMPLNKPGILYMSVSGKPPVPFGDGVKCPYGTTFRYIASNSGPTGSMTYGPGLVAYSFAHYPPAGQIVAGSTWHMQAWYRDSLGPCGMKTNLSNAVRLIFVP